MRPEAELMGNLPIGFAFLLLGFFAFAYVYAKGYEGGDGVVEGIRFGVLVSLIVVGFGLIWHVRRVPDHARRMRPRSSSTRSSSWRSTARSLAPSTGRRA